MSLVSSILSSIRRITIVILIAIAFLFGLASTVYLSLRSPEVTVPNVVGKDRFEAEKILAEAELNFRVRAARPSNQAKPDTVLFQLPRPGEVVKAGQTVAMDISRAAKEGETPETVKPAEDENPNTNTASNANENKPKKPKNKNANENVNGNENVNANTSANGNINVNRPANVNRPLPNVNAQGASPTPPHSNVNATPRANINGPEDRNANSRPVVNQNSRVNANQNDNRRPIPPKPSPSVPNKDKQTP
ncbi:MAG TPA: PASTA domain-containing protein [Pyrinomonadaceae bacterium]|nr:PASTA domain-containing protein [Pyrinomonadaceae bacterium]